MPSNAGRYKVCRLPDKKYGSLTVMNLAKIENRIRYYRVKCSCGNVSIKSLQAIEKPVKQFWKACAECEKVFRREKVIDCKNETKVKFRHNVIDMPFTKRVSP